MSQEELDFEKRPHVCPTCGTKFVEYKFGLNKGLLAFLKALARAGEPTHLEGLGLTSGQYTNHPQVRHWGLAEIMAPVDEEEKRKGGKWRLTPIGLSFLRGEATMPKYAITFRGKLKRHDGPYISVSAIEDGYQYQGDYRDQAREQLRHAD